VRSVARLVCSLLGSSAPVVVLACRRRSTSLRLLLLALPAAAPILYLTPALTDRHEPLNGLLLDSPLFDGERGS
jgi:hypothetical protein